MLEVEAPDEPTQEGTNGANPAAKLSAVAVQAPVNLKPIGAGAGFQSHVKL